MNWPSHKIQNTRKQLSYYERVDNARSFIDYINNRLKILEYDSITPGTIMNILDFARKNELGKVISNCRIKNLEPFRNCQFKVEGLINGFFSGEDAYCVSYFVDKDREISRLLESEDAILEKSVSDCVKPASSALEKYTIRSAEESDIPGMIKIFSSVFTTYPSPVFDQDYLKKVLNEQTLFKVAVENGSIISIASAEQDKNNLNAEITDCATYPSYRGKGILTALIEVLEQELAYQGYKTLYSLARAINPGINRSLSNLNYQYRGRLLNNCHICGNFEDMNVWVKSL